MIHPIILKPVIEILVVDWDYEGTLTAGRFSSIYGKFSSLAGSLTPLPAQVSGFDTTTDIYWYNNYVYVRHNNADQSADYIEIDGSVYEIGTDAKSVNTLSNPFVVGNDYAVKLG
jgi:hypothetical protein